MRTGKGPVVRVELKDESREENRANLHYGACPRCGRLLHKKESRLICKNKACGYKRKRNS